MKTIALALTLACCLAPLHAQKTRFGQEPPRARPGVDYPIAVHISGIRVRSECTAGGERFGYCFNAVYADAAFNRNKVELMVWTPGTMLADLVPGDYKVRFLKAGHKVVTTMLNQEYELLMPDNTVWRCTVTGLYE
jgi:hypothetical protein